VCALFLVAAPLERTSPGTALWATPAILLAAMLIAWAAESAQFFIAQGFALAILAWLQTMPEFAVEFVLAWRQRVDLLLANLTGSLRLLTGLGWPMIYFVAAFMHRRRQGKPLRRIKLHDHHCVEVVGLLVPLLYAMVVWLKASLTLFDAAVLILMYAAYLAVLAKMPPEEAEGIEDLELVPRTIVKSRPRVRTALIASFFVGGGLLIYISAEPFLGSLLAVSVILGVPSFVFVQWLAPLVSEFPEKVSALGADGRARPNGAHEHGVEQHQPVDPAGRHAADRVLDQPRHAVHDPARFPPAARAAHDHRPIADRHDLPVEHGAGLVGGDRTVRALGLAVRHVAGAAGARLLGLRRQPHPLVGDGGLPGLGRGRHGADVHGKKASGGDPPVPGDVAHAHPAGAGVRRNPRLMPGTERREPGFQSGASLCL
jgi:Ca2+/Na+ antiporter